MDDKSILLRLAEAGRPAPRLQLKGPAPEAPPGKDRYEMLGEIARGGVGVVHRARDTDLGRDVALKVLRDEHVTNPEIVQRFVEEAQIGGQLQHPGIVPVLELGVREGRQPFFAMKLVKGETLSAALAARPDPAADRRRILGIYAQACQTVAYAHARGVIHRDLKPSNIMIGAFGEVQVVDWGFAKVLRSGGVDDERRARRDTTVIATVRSATEGSASIAGSVMGTPAYMPPEQALGHVEDLDARADVFALGAILCEILTGKPPYTGTGQEQLIAASQCRLDDAHARLAACADAELAALSKRAMSPLPKDRPAAAREMAEALSNHLVATERRAHEARVLAARRNADLEHQQRSRRLTFAVAASVVGLVLLGGGARWWLAHEAAQRDRRREAAVESALQEATRLGAAGDYVAAVAAAERARDLGGGAAETFLIQLRRDRDTADATAKRRADDEALLAELEEIREGVWHDLDAQGGEQECIAAFRRRQLDPADPEPLVRRLAASHLAAEFASCLHDWASRRKGRLGQDGADWRQIESLARAVDPSAGNNAIRDACLNSDGPALRALLESRAIEDLPRTMLSSLGLSLASLGQQEAAIVFLRRACDRYPDDFWVHLDLGQEAPTHAERARALAAAVALRPRSAVTRVSLGIALMELGEIDAAIAAHREALRLKPDLAMAHFNLGGFLYQRGDYDGAITHSREAIRLRPNDSSSHDALGMSLLAKGDRDGAIAAYREAIRLRPDFAESWRNLGYALSYSQDLPGAIAAFREAIRLKPDYELAWISLGYALNESHDVAGAIAAYRQAILLEPGNALSHTNLGAALAAAGDFAAAIVEYREAIRLKPDLPQPYCGLADCLFKLRDHHGGVAAYREAVSLEPTNAKVRTNLGIALRVAGDLQGSLAELREAIRLDHTNPNAHHEMGLTLHDMGDIEGAIDSVREAVRLKPDDPDPRVSLGAFLSNYMGDHDAAAAHFEAATRLVPANAMAHYNLGVSLARRGRFREGLAALRRAEELGHPASVTRAWIDLVESRVGLEERLAEVLSGAAPPGGPRERLEFAEICSAKRLHAEAVRLYEQAFEDDAALADSVASEFRYNAACAAAAAGLRDRALGWLRADLAALKRTPESAASMLMRWRIHVDLAAVRDRIDDLPEAERKGWKQLWADVDALLAKARAG